MKHLLADCRKCSLQEQHTRKVDSLSTVHVPVFLILNSAEFQLASLAPCPCSVSSPCLQKEEMACAFFLFTSIAFILGVDLKQTRLGQAQYF